MRRFTLTHLTFVGTNVPDASVDFSPHVTVIHGPSDTGKSFIVDAIDFVLGAKALKEIPERDGYDRVLLGLELPDGDSVTLARSTDGGNISLYRADLRYERPAQPDKMLSAKHSATKTSNLSRFLLGQIGLDEKQVRKNAYNQTNMLSFRDITKLCIIGETRMQAEEAPGISGQPFNKTKEISILKLLLTGEDDSALETVPSPQERKRLRGARQEVAERMLDQLETQLQDVTEPTELNEQLAKLNRAISEHTAAVGDLARQRGQLLVDRTRIEIKDRDNRIEYSDVGALIKRFELLRRQYESDLARLEMIAEAGNFLGYFQRGTCNFCGAEPADQHLNIDCAGDMTSFGLSVEAEILKTRALHQDLLVTIESVTERSGILSKEIEKVYQESSRLQTEIEALDARIAPHEEDLSDLLAQRSEVEKYQGLYDQVASLEKMIRDIASESDEAVANAATSLSLTTVKEFSAEISKRLLQWGYPDAARVRYDRNELDIIAADQMRSAHGKGVRAILHAAFTLALAQYCFDRELPHPGFVVLDSPLVTYRPPDHSHDDDEAPPEDVVRAFYRNIQENFDGQVIVMENTDPLEPLGQDAKDIPFTKRASDGRYGFLPMKASVSSLAVLPTNHLPKKSK